MITSVAGGRPDSGWLLRWREPQRHQNLKKTTTGCVLCILCVGFYFPQSGAAADGVICRRVGLTASFRLGTAAAGYHDDPVSQRPG